ncbi:serine hydrolase [Flavobacterium sp.]|uniref:serine hydrolase n=1 Tax=Flavobacterium sp. TaxID=239 RepID=UPI002B4B3B38|nr:serine hydrolase [Flavobacterium sp.]HLP63867.1 serine hydrolase [Flavobacterium sp.]
MKNQINSAVVKTAFFASVFFLATFISSFAQTKAEKIDQLMSKYAEYEQFNGSVLVAEQGKVIFKKGYGKANMEWDIPNQSNTKFRLGSITKQFTSMLILQLFEQGKLKLDVPITAYLPDYPKKSGDKITIHHLLTHTAGVPNYTSFPNFFKETSKDYYTPEQFVKLFSDLPLEFEPGTKFAYSNSGYFLLGYIIEKVSSKTYEECLQTQILTPVKMTNSGFDHTELITKNRAAAYEKRGDVFVNAAYIDMNLPYAAGSMYSTVEDLYLWDQALYDNKLISEKSKELYFGKHVVDDDGFYGYGWGFYELPLDEFKKVEIIQHSGGINGFNTLISRIPADKNLTVFLNNTGSTNLNEMNTDVRAILYDKPYTLPKMSLAKILYKDINSKGIDKALLNYNENKKTNLYALKENEMNSLGYELLQTGKVKEAIEVFKLNVAAYPKSGNCYDSLGEAYLASDDKKLALLNYKKSVELDPSNENGKRIIKELSE